MAWRRKRGTRGGIDGENAVNRANLESYARARHTLDRPEHEFHGKKAKAVGAADVFVDRVVAGHTTPSYISAPGGIYASGAVLALAVVAPVLGVDLTGTTAALMPSIDELGGEWGVRLAAAALGGVLAVAALVGGAWIAAGIHLPKAKGRLLVGLTVTAILIAGSIGIHSIGGDRSNGLHAARLLEQADAADGEISKLKNEIAKLRVAAVRGDEPTAAPAGVPALERRVEELERRRGQLEEDAANAKTTNSPTWIQFLGFIVAAFAGAYFELGSMLRLERRVSKLRGRADAAWARLYHTVTSLITVPLLELLSAKGETPQVDVEKAALKFLGPTAQQPQWTPLAELVERRKGTDEPTAGVDDEPGDSRPLKAA